MHIYQKKLYKKRLHFFPEAEDHIFKLPPNEGHPIHLSKKNWQLRKNSVIVQFFTRILTAIWYSPSFPPPQSSWCWWWWWWPWWPTRQAPRSFSSSHKHGSRNWQHWFVKRNLRNDSCCALAFGNDVHLWGKLGKTKERKKYEKQFPQSTFRWKNEKISFLHFLSSFHLITHFQFGFVVFAEYLE